MSDFKLNWEGKKVLATVNAATLKGINKTMANCVESAKRNHEWQNRTGTLEGSISIAEYAQKEGRGAYGLWGSKDVVYALIHELGGQAGRGRNVKIPARPYLRPAADAYYPLLTENIRSFM